MHFPSKSQGGRKGMRSTEQTCFVFYCIKGILQVSLSGNVFVMSKGCALEVPMGNFYGFDNIGEEVCSMFFVQTRGIINEGAAEGQDGSGDDSEL
ncbi:hypothetical protein WICPIJ_005660 [Wickerhamomyces pijperi]|uniref:Mif2/CENP-C cupin domain-containing protein n=1 Tax=Wickerhamomyces pijperi TaxID=599730 RepID=A0A9P8TLL8_WICPI|nr:hypothetical protein WICPIJ_005660 [Wickerhamomyces pijperi]